MGNAITDKAVKAIGRMWIPVSDELEAKRVDGSPVFQVGVEYAIVVDGDVIRGKVVMNVDNVALLGTALRAGQDAVEAFFKTVPPVGIGMNVVTKDTAGGTRTVTTTIPAATASQAVTPVAARPATAPAPAPTAAAEPRPRGRPKAAAAPPPPAPVESDDPSEPGDGDDSTPISPGGFTLQQLGNVVCTYGKKGGSMHGKRFAELTQAQLQFLATSEEFAKYFDREDMPGLQELRQAAIDLIELKKIIEG